MRKELLRKAISGTITEKFDATKRISDYVGMITRLVFLFAIIGFVEDTIDYQAVASFSVPAISLLAFLVMLVALGIFMTMAFVRLSQDVLREALRVDRPAGQSRLSSALFEVAQPISFLLILLCVGGLLYAVPTVTRQLADKQMHREVSTHQPASGVP